MKKRIYAIVIAGIMVLAMALTACGSGTSGGGTPDTAGGGTQPDTAEKTEIDISALKTLGDLYAQVPENLFRGHSIGGDKVVFIFESGGTLYRAIASPSQEQIDKAIPVDRTTEEGKKELESIFKDVPLDKMEDLNDQKLSEESIKALIGKTGEELLQDGWSVDGSYMLGKEPMFYMSYGPFSYEVTFEGKSDLLDRAMKDESFRDTPEFDIEKIIKTMTVKSIENPNIGNNALEVQ